MSEKIVVTDSPEVLVVTEDDSLGVVYVVAAGPQGAPGPQGPAGAALPNGGTSGQILAKNSSTNQDAGWRSLVAGDHIGISDDGEDISISVNTAGQPNGLAELDSTGKISIEACPVTMMMYKGTWNAVTNTPVLSDASGMYGELYVVSVGGTRNLGSGSISFISGDFLLHNGSIWEKTSGAISSVNGQTGIVVLDADDIPQVGTVNKFTTAADISRLANTSGTNTGDQDLSGLVPTSRTVNGQALSSNITLTTANIADSTDKRYITDAQLSVLGNTTGTNTGDQSVFSQVVVQGQSTVFADSTSDALTLVAGNNIQLTTDASTDSITITSTAIGGNAFGSVAVSGQSTVEADSVSDTLTLVAGSNINITTNATSDSITISATGDFNGPASSADNAIVRFDGTTGKLVQNSLATISDTGEVDAVGVTGDFLAVDTAATPAAAVGRLIWDDADGTLSLGLKGGNVDLKVGEQSITRCYNDAGVTLTKGQVVYVSGAQGNRVAVKLAQANTEATSRDTLGFVAETIAPGNEGWLVTEGTLQGLNTSAFAAGATIFLSESTAGAFTTTKPTSPNHGVILGFIARIHANAGLIYVKVDNGYEIDELHNVKITGTPAAGSLLIRDATEGTWENATLTAGSNIAITNGDASISIAVANVGQANGIASLDSGGKVPANQLPSSLMDYRGVWNASTNTPSLADGTGSAGDVYRVTVAGSQNLGSGSITFEIGDYVIYNGTTWEKSDTTDAVASVNSQVGIVVLNADDISDATTTKKFTTTADISRLANTSGTNTGDQDLSGYVPTSRTINGQALSSNVTLTTGNLADSTDKRYVTDAQRTVLSNTSGTNTGDQDLSGLVPNTRTVNGQALSANVTLTTANISDSTDKRYVTDAQRTVLSNTSGTNTGDQDLSGYVPTTRTINGQALSANVTLTTANISDSTDKRYVTNSQLSVIENTSGVNSGDQNVFTNIAVSGQSTIVAASLTDTLNLAAGSNITITTNTATDTVTIASSAGQQLGTFRNKIHNGNFNIANRGTSFVAGANNNDTYNIDRWFILSNGNDIVDITRSTTEVPSYQATSIALDVETINEKFGIAQIVEDIDCKDLIGQTVTLSFQAKVSSSNLNNLKAAVIAWNGTANIVTSDMVSAWNNAGVNPTLRSNLSYVNTPTTPATGAFTVANTDWNSYSITTTVPATVSGSPVTNLIVFIWSDTKSNALGNFLYVTEVQLEQSATATPFERLPVSMQEQLCERFLAAYPCRGAERFFSGWGGPGVTTNSMPIYFPFRVMTRVPVTNIAYSSLGHFEAYATYPNAVAALSALNFLVGGSTTGVALAVTTGLAYNSGVVGFLYPVVTGTSWIVFTGAEL